MFSFTRGARKTSETVYDKTIRELSPVETLPTAERLVQLAAAYRAAGEEQEALTLLSLSHLLRADPNVFNVDAL